MATARRHRCPFCVDSHAELTRIASDGALDPEDPATLRPEVLAAQRFLDAGGPVDLPGNAVEEALRIRIIWDVVNRLANAFGFVLRGDQLYSGTRALHRFGYRFPGFLLAGGTRTDLGDPVEDLRHAVFVAPATTDPARRTAAATGGAGLNEPWRSYTALVRDASWRVTDDDVAGLAAPDDEVFELTVAAAVGAALAAYDADRGTHQVPGA
jgi:hypothetical protein